MNEREQQIAIAEALNLGIREKGVEGWYCKTCRAFVEPLHVTYEETHDPRFGGCGGSVDIPTPDYIRDLNAVHEAEKALTSAQTLAYLNCVYQQCPSYREGDYWHDNFQSQWEVATAAAAQRVKAFLRVTGKWKD